MNRIVDGLVLKYSRDLDTFIDQTREWLNKSDLLGDDELEILTMKIPVAMYFAGSGLESLGIEGDNAKQVRLEAFNLAYMATGGTINDKTSFAEQETISEALMEIAFNRAYKKLKLKLDMAEHVFSGAKKVLSKRMQEMFMHGQDYVPRGKSYDRSDL